MIWLNNTLFSTHVWVLLILIFPFVCWFCAPWRRWLIKKKSGWNVLPGSTSNHSVSFESSVSDMVYTLHHFMSVMLAPIPESRWAYFGHCIIWCTDMAIAFKPTCSLNAFALKYVNSQCQHDSLIINLAAPQPSKTSFYSLRLAQVFSKIGRKITAFRRNRQISVGLFFKTGFLLHYVYKLYPKSDGIFWTKEETVVRKYTINQALWDSTQSLIASKQRRWISLFQYLLS